MLADLAVALVTAAVAVGSVAVFFWKADREEARAARSRADLREVAYSVNGGFEPARVVLQGGPSIRLRVSRDHDGESWWDDLTFPYLRCLRELPEGASAVIEAGRLDPGEYLLFCDRGSKRGVLVVEELGVNEAPWEE